MSSVLDVWCDEIGHLYYKLYFIYFDVVVRENYHTACLAPDEEEAIEDLRKELSLSHSVANSIRETAQKTKDKADIHHCRHCGGSLDEFIK